MTTPEQRAHEVAGDWIMGKVDMGELERLIAVGIRAAIEAAANDAYEKAAQAVESKSVPLGHERRYFAKAIRELKVTHDKR